MNRTRNLESAEVPDISLQDVCTHLFKICGSCQAELLNARGIACLFDVDSGVLSAWQCDIIGQIVSTLISEICHWAAVGTRGGQITVSMHRTGLTWVLSVTDEGIRNFDNGRMIATIPSVQGRVLSLKGSCGTRLTAHGAVTAILFSTVPWQVDTMSLDAPTLAIERRTEFSLPADDRRSRRPTHQSLH